MSFEREQFYVERGALGCLSLGGWARFSDKVVKTRRGIGHAVAKKAVSK